MFQGWKYSFLISVLLVFLLVSCQGKEALVDKSNHPGEASGTPEAGQPDDAPAASSPDHQKEETDGSGCYEEGIHPIAASIVEKYPETDYEQVMTWFCKGAEFEDILLALLTARLSERKPEAMLESIADGQTWEEIWQELDLEGLVEK